MENAEQFDWSERRSVVVKRVDPIAIYIDNEGDIIIRQQHAHSPVDSVITIPAVHAQSVIDGLQRHIRGRFAASLVAAGTG
jgi:hypothetical protein